MTRGACNYVRFFRLAKQAPFLQACLLRNHFNTVGAAMSCRIVAFIKAYLQVRLDALWKIKSAFKASRPTIDELGRWLGFDGSEVLVDFLRAFDSNGSLDGDEVVLANPQEPDVLDVPRVRTKWIDGLRQGQSISHIISGYAEPPVLQDHQSKDSFEGVYRRIVPNEATHIAIGNTAQQAPSSQATLVERRQAAPSPKPAAVSKPKPVVQPAVKKKEPEVAAAATVPSGLFGQKSKPPAPKPSVAPTVVKVAVPLSALVCMLTNFGVH